MKLPRLMPIWALLISTLILSSTEPIQAASGGYRGYAAILTITNDDNGIRTISSIGASGALTLNGVLVSGGTATVTATPLTKVAQKISVLSAGNDSGITLTIVGNDADGMDETEVLTLANVGTVHSARWYYDVESITASGASAGNVTIGVLSAQGAISRTVEPQLTKYDAKTSLSVTITGTLTLTIEATLSNVPTTIEPTWHDTLDLTAISADANGNFNTAVGGFRINITAYTSGTAEILSLQGQL